MRRLRDRSLVPPDNFRWVDKDTGLRITSPTYSDWIATAKEHRKANGLDIPLDLPAQMEDQICGTIPPEYCTRDAGDVTTWVDTNFGWEDFREGMAVFTEWGKQGLPLVEQPEANRRGAICYGCPLNVHVRGCQTCRKITAFLTGAVAKKKTPHDDGLRACAICKCSIISMIWFPADLLTRNESSERQALRPQFCWAKRTSENYAAS